MECSSKILAAQREKVHSHNAASASHKLVYPHPVQGNIILPEEALFASTAHETGLPKQPHPSSNHMYMKPRSPLTVQSTPSNSMSYLCSPDLTCPRRGTRVTSTSFNTLCIKHQTTQAKLPLKQGGLERWFPPGHKGQQICKQKPKDKRKTDTYPEERGAMAFRLLGFRIILSKVLTICPNLGLWFRSFCQQSSISWCRAFGQSIGGGSRQSCSIAFITCKRRKRDQYSCNKTYLIHNVPFLGF